MEWKAGQIKTSTPEDSAAHKPSISNFWICTSSIDFKQNYHQNYKQENHGAAYYTKFILWKMDLKEAHHKFLKIVRNENSYETRL